MKDFTKKQEKRTDKVGTVKCNTCNWECRSFGVPVGTPCPNPDNAECTGKLMKVDEAASDARKRRTDMM